MLVGEFDFPERDWEKISLGAKDLLRGLLRRHQKYRMSAAEALNHAWFQMPDHVVPRSPPLRVDILGKFRSNLPDSSTATSSHLYRSSDTVSVRYGCSPLLLFLLRRFQGLSRLKKIALTVIAQHMDESDIDCKHH